MVYEDQMKALRWLANMFPYTHPAKSETDKMSNCIHLSCKQGANAIQELEITIAGLHEAIKGLADDMTRWIPVTERLPECDLGAEVGNIEWISCGIVHAGCFGRGGKYRDTYFRTWTDAGEGMDAKDADYWRAVTLPEPQKER